MICSGAGLAVTALLLLQPLPIALAAQYIPVTWSSKYYGPDGPWQAVKIVVGGTRPDILLINEDHKELDLMPGGEWNTKILTSKACETYKDGTCGKGGTWDPEASATVVSTDGWIDDAAKVNSSGQGILLQATTVGSFSYWNSSMVIIKDISIANPDGSKRGPELGALALGGPEQSQKFATDATRPTAPMVGFSYPGGAFNKSDTKSFSYGLQIGSAYHGYTGSLIFGGYDKGRLIGPYTTFNKAPTLLDINIGVAAGGSPWDFKEKKGLLISNTSQVTTLAALPDPRQTYLHLPGKTCEEIAKYIPIKMDSTLKYWLWDTGKPEYKTIVTSPAYLGFTFPPAPGASNNVTIKVPFSLLNLTLDAPITKKPTPYFPCQSYNPASGQPYILGRAFLQAAFIGRNWNRQISWLGQAPGPGASKNGLGNVMLDINDTDLDLPDVFTNANLFTQSWANYWTPLPDPEGSSSSPSPSGPPFSPNDKNQPNSELSTGVKVGIGLGAVAVVLLAIGVILLFLRRRQKSAPAQFESEQPKYFVESKPMYSAVELEHPLPEMQPNITHWTYELPTQTPQLETTTPRQPGSPVLMGRPPLPSSTPPPFPTPTSSTPPAQTLRAKSKRE
ncbi:hypothetical protein GQ44DRAFT_776397 [Phaeosphaeriaceae sp. PMI808]|nr:hypothetical protein GQ44DRAFT_776397 [Phaeosphaeriaceae sp. PMI808]